MLVHSIWWQLRTPMWTVEALWPLLDGLLVHESSVAVELLDWELKMIGRQFSARRRNTRGCLELSWVKQTKCFHLSGVCVLIHVNLKLEAQLDPQDHPPSTHCTSHTHTSCYLLKGRVEDGILTLQCLQRVTDWPAVFMVLHHYLEGRRLASPHLFIDV